MDVNAHIRRYLEHAVAAGRLAHAAIFAGPAGVGKRDMALWLAKRLNCASLGAGGPCGACRSCARIGKGTHPDVITLVPEAEDAAASQEAKSAGRTAKQIISIDQIRRLERTTAYAPYEGGSRVVIFDPADAMEEAGMNALLKLIEEPPPKTYLVFITSRPESLLPTIRSRAQAFPFRELPPESIREILVRDKTATAEQARWMAALSQGSLERALAATPEESAERRNLCLRALLAVREKDAPVAIVESAEALSKDPEKDDAYSHREFARESLLYLASFLRDALVLKSVPEAEDWLVHPDLAARLHALGASLTEDALLDAVFSVEDAVRAVDQNVERRLIFENFLFRLRQKAA